MISSVNNIIPKFILDESRTYRPITRSLRTIDTKEYKNAIDFTKYKIGDKIIYKNFHGNSAELIIHGWCKTCIETPTKGIDEFCKHCKKVNEGCGFYIYEGNKKICKHCYNLFVYNNKDDIYCNECIIYENDENLSQDEKEKYCNDCNELEKDCICRDDNDSLCSEDLTSEQIVLKMKRSHLLYEKYGEKLIGISFNINVLGVLDDVLSFVIQG